VILVGVEKEGRKREERIHRGAFAEGLIKRKTNKNPSPFNNSVKVSRKKRRWGRGYKEVKSINLLLRNLPSKREYLCPD